MSAPSTSALPPDDFGNDLATRVGSVPSQDLSKEGLLAQLPRDGENRPLLGGIPLSAKLGQGGMGAVYYGVHPRLHNEVAVKVLPFHLADKNPILIKRFFAEARVAARVKSPHIVNVMDVNEDEGVFYLVMEFIDGLTAAQILRKVLNGETVPPVDATGPHAGMSQRVAPVGAGAIGEPGIVGGLPEWAALEICMGAADGLAAAHGYDVIHRDVKPDNIIIPRLPRRGSKAPLDLRRAKLADLGLAKPEDSNSIGTISQLTMGTPGYMSPEQIRDAKRASKPSDVFSLGSTLYALLAGRSPFSGNSVGDLLVKTITEPHEPLKKFRPDVSAVTHELIDACLSKDPAERFKDGAELLEALQMAAAGVTYPSGALRSMGDSRVSSNARASRIAEMLTPPPENTPANSAKPAPGAAAATGSVTTGGASGPGGAVGLAPAPVGTFSAEGQQTTAQVSPVALAEIPPAQSGNLDTAAGNHTDLTPPHPLPPVLIGASQPTPLIPPQRISKQPPVIPDAADLNYSARVSRMLSRLMRAEPGHRKSPLPLIMTGVAVLALIAVAGWWFGFESPRRNAAAAYQTAMTGASTAEAQARGAEDMQSEKKYWQAVLTASQTALNAVPNDPDAKATHQRAADKLDQVTQEIRRSAEIYRDAMNEAQTLQPQAEKASDLTDAQTQWRAMLTACNRALRARADDTNARALKALAQSKIDDLEGAQKAVADARSAVHELETQAAAAAAAADYAEQYQLLSTAATRCQAALRAFPDPQLADVQARLDKKLPVLDAMVRGKEALQQAQRSADPSKTLSLVLFAADVFGRAAAADPDPVIATTARDARDQFARAFYGGFAEVRRLDPYADLPTRDNLLGCALSPDQRSLALFAPGGLLQIWSPAERKCLATLPAGTGAVLDAVFLNDHELATGSYDKNVSLWTLPAGDKPTLLLPPEGATSHQGPVKQLQLSPDGQTLLSVSDDKTVALWDLPTRKRIAVLAGHTDYIASAVFSPDGHQVLTASHDATARLWNARSGALIREFKGHTAKVYRAVFDHAGAHVLTVSEDKTAKIWDAATAVCQRTLTGHDGAVLYGEFSAHDDRVITAGNDATARVWNVATGATLFTLKGHAGLINRAQFCIDDTLALTTGADGTLRLWDLLDGSAIAVLAGHSGPVQSAWLTADGRAIFSAGDHTVRQWTNPYLINTAPNAPTTDDAYRLALGDARAAERTAQQVAGDPYSARSAWQDAVNAYDRALRMNALDADAATRRITAMSKVQEIAQTLAAREKELADCLLSADLAATAAAESARDDSRAGEALVQWTRAGECLRQALRRKPGDPAIQQKLDQTELHRLTGYFTRMAPVRTFTGHTARVEAVAFAPGGRQLASAGEDSTVRMWNALTGAAIFSNQGHKAWPNNLQFNADGSLLVSADNGALFFWDPAKGTLLGSLTEPNDAAMAFTLDGKSLFTLASAGTETAVLKTWDAHSLQMVKTLELPQLAINKLAFSPDQRYAVAQLADGGLRVLEAPQFKPVKTLESTDDAPVGSLAIDADDHLALAACMDGSVRLWSVESGKRLFTLKGHRGPVSFAVFSPDSSLVLSGGADRTARLWNVATGVELTTLYGHPDTCYAGAFSPDGRACVIAAGSSVTLWVNPQDASQPLYAAAGAPQLRDLSIAAGKAAQDRGAQLASKDFEGAVRATEIALASFATALAVHPTDPATEGEFADMQKIRANQLLQLDLYDRAVAAGQAFADKARAARAAGADPAPLQAQATEQFNQALALKPGDTRVQNLIDQVRVALEGNPYAGVAQIKALEACPSGVTALKFLPDGQRLLIGLADGEVRITSIETGKLRSFKDHTGTITSLDLSPDGAAFASASLDKTVRIVVVESGATAHVLQVKSPVRVATFSPTGKTLVTGSDDGVTRLWDVATGSVYKELAGHSGPVTAAAISRDGNYVLTASEDKSIKLWDLLEGKVLRSCDGHTAAVLGAWFSPDGKSILSVSADKSARLWNVADGKQLHELAGHDDKVLAAAFFSSGKAAVTAGADKSVRIWDVPTGAPCKRLDDGIAPIRAVAISPDGKTIAGGGDGKIIRLWADPADKTNPLLFNK